MDIVQNRMDGKGLNSLVIDYEKYGAGEAALAWLDASVVIHSKQKALVKAHDFIRDMVDEVSYQKLPIGHLKFFLESGTWQSKISYTTGHQELDSPNSDVSADHVRVLVNARVETDPDELKKIFYRSIQKIQNENCHADIIEVASFQPGYPKPTHRLND